MFCTYCNANRPQNEAPCPNCGAPSPLRGQMNAGGWGAAGPQMNASMPPSPLNQFSPVNDNQLPFNTPASMNSWNQFSPAANSPMPQMSFDAPPSANGWNQFSPAANSPVPQMSFDAPPPVNGWNQFSPADNNQWNNQQPQMSFEASPAQWGMDLQNSPQATQEPSKSLVPVPYQGQMGLQMQQANMAMSIMQAPSIERMLPALPEDSVYVPPMYTKPRPIIPRYRIISGLLSILIVSLLVCGGATYYAQASGNLKVLGRSITGAPPARIQPTAAPQLPDPPAKTDTGPAYSKIPAATTTLRIDKNDTPLQPTRIFQVNQQFYLTFTMPNTSGGTVTAKWYMNGIFYRETPLAATKQGTGMVNAWITMQYKTPAEGTVELDWNNQLAQRLYFVVR